MTLDDYRTHLEFAIGVPFTDGNRVVPLKNGDEIFPAMLAAIRAASSHLEFSHTFTGRGLLPGSLLTPWLRKPARASA
ncbi:hypothetical protein [Congregibacter litoralis]|uniref:Uncharacterized protein n=1 Tax=Congregibacter litoralis KT71 TaxID=314285 RepID=A4AB61_9GAMM|nr:hypothetical protein [Congregibacter litoralis]EAQ96933.2 hypothetical protein KT71_11549 [Congregibacter litoralis KT71]